MPTIPTRRQARALDALGLIHGDWDCEESPIKVCIYYTAADPAHDRCLFCGEPEERK